jgi:hypothetical protein
VKVVCIKLCGRMKTDVTAPEYLGNRCFECQSLFSDLGGMLRYSVVSRYRLAVT